MNASSGLHRRSRVARWSAVALLLGGAQASAQSVCLLYRYTPSHVEAVAERVLVRPASRFVLRHAAVLRAITERVLVQPERRTVRREPARFTTVTERVLLRAASRTPRYLPPIRTEAAGRTPVSSRERNGPTRSVELRPAQTVLDTTPAVYTTRARRVLVHAVQTIVQKLPAIFATRTRSVQVMPERAEVGRLPAEYRTVRRALLYPAIVRLTASTANCAYGGPRVGWSAAFPRPWLGSVE